MKILIKWNSHNQSRLIFKMLRIIFNEYEEKKETMTVKTELKFVVETIKNITDMSENEMCYLEMKI